MPLDKDLPKGDISNLKNIIGYLRPYKLSLAAVCVALIISSSSVLSFGAGIKHLVDEGFATGNAALLDKALLILLGIIVVLALATYARFYFITTVGEKVVADIRKDIYSHLLSLSPGFYETNKTGEIMSRMTTDTTVLQVVIGSSLSVALRNILMFTGGLILLISTSPKLSGYIAIMIPLIVLPVMLLGKKVRGLSRNAQKKIAELSANVEETLSGVKTVQAYGQEEFEFLKFSKKAQDALSAAVERVKVRGALTAIVILIAFGSVGAILWLGGRDVLAGSISAGELLSFIFYSLVVAGAFGAISEVIGDIQRAAGSVEALMELLNEKSHVIESESPAKLPEKSKDGIEIKDVTFCYPARAEYPALHNISLRVNGGERMALVGPSGAGKSTIFQLLMRFYDPQQGEIKIDGISIKELSLKELRRQYAYVAQEPIIFSSSVRDNIAYGDTEADEEAIINAAKAARAYEFINKLPDGFDSFVGEKGVRLSGGEKQRIAIARAILRNPRILLLDEATSALDAENEKLVQEALDKLMEGRTTLIIAHRLATVQKADRIIVINDGRVEAEGTHQSLIKKDSLYKRLADLQFAA